MQVKCSRQRELSNYYTQTCMHVLISILKNLLGQRFNQLLLTVIGINIASSIFGLTDSPTFKRQRIEVRWIQSFKYQYIPNNFFHNLNQFKPISLIQYTIGRTSMLSAKRLCAMQSDLHRDINIHHVSNIYYSYKFDIYINQRLSFFYIFSLQFSSNTIHYLLFSLYKNSLYDLLYNSRQTKRINDNFYPIRTNMH